MAVTLGLILVASLKQAWSMTFIAVRYPHGQRNQSVQRGNTARGTPRSLCQNPLWGRGRCLLDSGTRGGVPAGTHTLLAMRLQASGVRETARSLPLGPHPVRRARSTQESGRRCTPLGCAPGILPRGPGTWSALGKGRRRGGRGGRWSRRKATRAGSGLPSLPTPARAGPTAVGAAKPTGFGGSQRCWRPAGCPARRALMGAPPRGTAIPTSPAPAHATRRKARARL